MKKLSTLCILLAFVGCGPQVQTSNFQAPLKTSADFKDCIAADVTNANGISITVVRCPNSTVTTTRVLQGGAVQTSVVVEGK